MFGRQLARQRTRDSEPALGTGVVVVQGEITGGGSVKHPRLHASDDLVLEIREVPRAAVEKWRGAEGSENCQRSEIVASASAPAPTPTAREQAIKQIRALMAEHSITLPEVQ
jgi:hypothetical protein